MRKNRTLVDQNMLLRITFKYCKYAVENHNQERKSAAENQFRLRSQLSWALLCCCCCRDFWLRPFICAIPGGWIAFIDASVSRLDLCCLLGSGGHSSVRSD